MTSPEVGSLRLARAFAFGLAALGLSLLAHVAAGGEPPSLQVTAVLGFGVVWVSVFLTWRRLRIATSVVSLGLLQVALHEVLSWTSMASSCAGLVHSVAPAHVHGAVHGAVQGAVGAATMCPSAAASSPITHVIGTMGSAATAGAAMTLAHTVAAVLLGVLLARADGAVWFLARLVWPRIPAVKAAPVVVPRVGTPADTRAPGVAQVAVLAAAPRRGPPGGLAPVPA